MRVGLPREAVVRALVTELDLTTAEAVTAWQSATPLYDKIDAIRQATKQITHPTAA